MGISDWFKRKMAMLALATSNVEKNALGGERNSLVDGIGMQRYQESNRLSDGLMRGEVTQQVMDMRWRMYKILEEAKNIKTMIVGEEEIGIQVKLNEKGEPVLDENGNEIPILDENGNEIKLYRNIVEVRKAAPPNMSKYKADTIDNYAVEIIVNNEEIATGVSHGMNIVLEFDKDENSESTEIETDSPAVTFESKIISQRSVGSLSFDELNSSIKSEKIILVNREFPSKINIEQYTEKLIVRTINEKEKLLEFYVSKYVDEFDRKTVFLISEIKKCITNPRLTNIVDITNVGFLTTTKTIGAYPNKLYEYEIINFDKIIEFEGFYVIKFKANMLVEGEDIFEKYRIAELDEKYDTKAKKDIR